MRNARRTQCKLPLLMLALCLPAFALSQQDAPAAEIPEEIVVVGERRLTDLRIEMLQLEKAAYDVFNQFNDERRFDIHCFMHSPTGTRFEMQTCEPEFEIQAKRTHARHYFENMRDYYDQLARGVPNPSENTPPVHVPMEAVIASQQKAYRNKMKEVAEQHPEFLEALIRYTESKQRYEQALGLGAE